MINATMLKNNKVVEKSREERIKNTISNTEYMDWISKFTNDYVYFDDTEFLNGGDYLSDEDIQKAGNLNNLYGGISKYAKENLISPEKIENGNYYLVKYNNEYYEIGMALEVNLVFFCHKCDFDKEKFYIDYMNVVNNKELPDTISLKTSLDSLLDNIEYLLECGVPSETIKDSVNEVLNKFEKENTRTLKKY